MKLYLVESALRAFLEEVAEGDGLLTPEQEARMVELCGGAEQLIEFLAMMSVEALASERVYRSMVSAAMDEVDALRAKADQHSARSCRASERVHKLMNQLGIEKYESNLFRITEVSHPRKVVTPEFFDVDQLPEKFVRTTKMLSKGDMIAAVDRGEELPEGFSVVRGKGIRLNKR